MVVAKTILSQIKAVDGWALASWGAREYVGGKVYNNQEGIKFKVNGTKTKRGSFAIITLDEGQDLYNIYTMRLYKGELKIDNTLEGVFVDQLVETLDNFIG